jgi:hypothetical protein
LSPCRVRGRQTRDYMEGRPPGWMEGSCPSLNPYTTWDANIFNERLRPHHPEPSRSANTVAECPSCSIHPRTLSSSSSVNPVCRTPGLSCSFHLQQSQCSTQGCLLSLHIKTTLNIQKTHRHAIASRLGFTSNDLDYLIHRYPKPSTR